jgi:hypothetical protein
MKLKDCEFHGKAVATAAIVANFGDIEVEQRGSPVYYFSVYDATLEGKDKSWFILEPHLDVTRLELGSCTVRFAGCSIERGKADVGILVIEQENMDLAICLVPAGHSTSTVKKAIGWASEKDFAAQVAA